MEKLQSQNTSGFCWGQRSILTILIVYTLLLGVCMYLYHYPDTHVRPQSEIMNEIPAHVQNIRNIVQMQTEHNEYIFQKNSTREFHPTDKSLQKNSTLNLVSKKVIISPTQKFINNSIAEIETNSKLQTVTEKKPDSFVLEKPVVPRPSVLFRYKSMRTSKPFENHCKSCAIVSSSGQLLGKRLGPEIDSYPCVLRMNTAPVRLFEKDVGSKTTVRVSCFISTRGLLSNPTLLTGVGKPQNVLMWGLYHKKNAWALKTAKTLNSRYKDIEFFAQEASGETFAGDVFKQETGQDRAKTNTWLSTGWFTMMVALDMCDEIHVYGMIPEDFCSKNPASKVKYHYYQNSPSPGECSYYKSQEGSSRGGHRFMTEKAIFERWGRRYNMTFHNPSWDLKPQDTDRKIDTPFMKKYSKGRR